MQSSTSVVPSAASAPLPRSTVLSAALHLTILALTLFFGWWSQREREKPPQIFEVVAGPGENYAATVAAAPTQTTADPKVSVYLPPAPPSRPIVRPEPTPTVAEKTPPPTPKPVEKKAEPTPKPVEKKPDAKPTPNPPKTETKPERVSFKDFVKENGAPKEQKLTKPAPLRVKGIDVKGVVQATMSHVSTGAGGTALTAVQADLLDRYGAYLRQKILNALTDAGVNDPFAADVQFQVNAAGGISNVQIVKSSGNGAFDRAVRDAVKSIGPVQAPPTKRTETFSTTITLREA